MDILRGADLLTVQSAGLLDDYLDIGGEAATWKQATGTNEYGRSTFADPVDIILIWFQEQHKILDERGEEITSDAFALLVEAVAVGDIIRYQGRDYPILSVTSEPPLVTGNSTIRTASFGTKVG